MNKLMIIFIIVICVLGCGTFFIDHNKEVKDLKTLEEISGPKTTLEGEPWPYTDFTKRLPKPEKGELEIVLQGKSKIQFKVHKLEYSDYIRYINIAKEKGFVSDSDGKYGYTAFNEDGYMIDIGFERGTMSVVVTN